MSGRMLGTFIVPIYTALPASGQPGQYAQVNNTLYQWDGSGWVAMWPLFIQATAPTSTATKYLWVNTSGGAGDNATLWVEDGNT